MDINKVANLTEKDLKEIKQLEQKMNVVIVAYEKENNFKKDE